MTEDPKKIKAVAKLPRTDVITVRLDPKLKYLTGLAARIHRRTMSSYIEWALEKSLENVALAEGPDWLVSIASKSSDLWDVDESDRFAKLALSYPNLLTHEDQVLWKLVRENGFLWKGQYSKNNEWVWNVQESSLIFERLRDKWDIFKEVALGNRPASDLPTWAKLKPSSGFDDLDEEIPF